MVTYFDKNTSKTWTGLSTDVKPLDDETHNIPNGSLFYEIDSTDIYMFDKTGNTWVIQPASSGGGGSGGTTDHSKLSNRNKADQHPMSAITGLDTKFTELSEQIVQSDWNENDPQNPAYVKNRICYKTYGPVNDVYPAKTTEFEVSNGNGISFLTSVRTPLESGDKVEVTFDGNTYVCEAVTFAFGHEVAIVAGNLAILGQPSSGEPFLIVYNTTQGTAIRAYGTSTSHELGIAYTKSEIIKIPEKYLPVLTGNIAVVNGKPSADITYEKIVDAYNKGYLVRLNVPDAGVTIPLVAVKAGVVMFAAIVPSLNLTGEAATVLYAAIDPNNRIHVAENKLAPFTPTA